MKAARRLFERLRKSFRRRWPRLEAGESPHQRQIFFRLFHVERNFGLPVKAVVILLLAYYLFLTNWFDNTMDERNVALATVRFFFVLYVLMNLSGGIMLAGIRQLPLRFTQLVVLIIAILDALLLASITLTTGGFNSPLYWVFVLLIVRNSISIPSAYPQIAANILVVLCYFLAGFGDMSIQKTELTELETTMEPFFLRIVVLGLMLLCSYGVQALFDRQRRAEEEAREHAIRLAHEFNAECIVGRNLSHDEMMRAIDWATETIDNTEYPPMTLIEPAVKTHARTRTHHAPMPMIDSVA